MGKHLLNIDGYIGSWSYSKQWLNAMLEGHDKDEVIINMSSLGGSLDHALAMHDRLRQHGNVTIILTGFNASSATVISMGGKTIRMSQNSFFLIHKAMFWIDEFGNMNEDDIEALITRLEKEKNEAAKITLQMAQMYSRFTKLPVQDILNLMKEETWLTADEAKEKGFIHEVYEPAPDAQNVLNDYSRVAMITASGLPNPNPSGSNRPVGVHQPTPGNQDQSLNSLNTIKILSEHNNNMTSQIITAIKEFFSPKTIKMEKQFKTLNAVLQVDKLEATAEGVFLNTDQLEAIEKEFTNRSETHAQLQTRATELETRNPELETSNAELQTSNTQLETRNTELQTSNTELETLIANLSQIDDSIATAKTNDEKIAAIRTLLAAKPAAAATQLKGADASKSADGVDWDTINKLPHNQNID